MPIFEYTCKECGKRFEAIVRGGDKPRCPKCKSTRLEQLLSVFAVAAPGSQKSSGSEPTPDFGGCGPSCGMNGGSCPMDDA